MLLGRYLHKYIYFFVSLPATKELVPTDYLDSMPPTFVLVVTVASESENKWESC